MDIIHRLMMIKNTLSRPMFQRGVLQRNSRCIVYAKDNKMSLWEAVMQLE
jgi:hypothetical protein